MRLPLDIVTSVLRIGDVLVFKFRRFSMEVLWVGKGSLLHADI